MSEMGPDLTVVDEWRKRAEAAEAECARLRAALEEVEWIGMKWRCPWCYESRIHAPNCLRQAALGIK